MLCGITKRNGLAMTWENSERFQTFASPVVFSTQTEKVFDPMSALSLVVLDPVILHLVRYSENISLRFLLPNPMVLLPYLFYFEVTSVLDIISRIGESSIFILDARCHLPQLTRWIHELTNLCVFKLCVAREDDLFACFHMDGSRLVINLL